jgi:Sec-independent protein secretion pathway component TatC
LLAVPIWLLFELGVYFSGWFTSRAGAGDDDEYHPLSESEMEAELDRIDAEDKDSS